MKKYDFSPKKPQFVSLGDIFQIISEMNLLTVN
jgi:hypothetical protein